MAGQALAEVRDGKIFVPCGGRIDTPRGSAEGPTHVNDNQPATIWPLDDWTCDGQEWPSTKDEMKTMFGGKGSWTMNNGGAYVYAPSGAPGGGSPVPQQQATQVVAAPAAQQAPVQQQAPVAQATVVYVEAQPEAAANPAAKLAIEQYDLVTAETWCQGVDMDCSHRLKYMYEDPSSSSPTGIEILPPVGDEAPICIVMEVPSDVQWEAFDSKNPINGRGGRFTACVGAMRRVA